MGPKRRIDAKALSFFAAAILVVALILAATFLGRQDSGRGIVLPSGPDLPNGFGGIAWDSKDQAYWAVTDNGHGSDIVPVLRLVEFSLAQEKITILRTEAITENGTVHSGDDFDPQDIAVAPDGTLWIVDSNHPWFIHLDRGGSILGKIGIASWEGHAPNRGPEGMAISPDGQTLYAVLQNALPSEPNVDHTEILRYNLKDGSMERYHYWIGTPGASPEKKPPNLHASGLIALGNDSLDVLDHGAGQYAQVYRVQLPAHATPDPLVKNLVIDLTHAGYVPPKPEGITINGVGDLVVINDADLSSQVTTEIWTFNPNHADPPIAST